MEARRFKEWLYSHWSKVVRDLRIFGCENLLELNKEERSATERKPLLFEDWSSVVQKTTKRRLCAGSRSFLAPRNTNSLELEILLDFDERIE
jgi:hypothetical protein